MKLGKYILGLALIAAGLTSCDQDNIGAIYEPTAANISFISGESSTLTKASSIIIPVAVSRSITTGTYTANVESSDESAGVTVQNKQVTFADGEGLAYVNVEFSNMAPGETYSCTLTLSPTDAATVNEFGSQIASTTVSVMCDFDWEIIGNGHYISPEWWGEEFDVPIEHAKNSNRYRMIGLFQSGYDIEFTIDGDAVYVPKQGSWVHSSYGVVSLQGYAGENDYAGPYDAATKTCTLALRHTVSAGSFGTFVDYLVMP